ncbi:IS256 family transposase [Pseudogracilibacillus sp. ICA-222130]|uniref:IS256 family transposase n=1 Tax=Pseudogracilibacillus sp. ICA-222130 TaxID=3134655 RepID=UPI0030BD1BFB
MTQINFTLNFDKLKEELVQSDLNDFVKSAMVLVLNEYMEKERDDYMENQAYDRSEDRHDYRNGYYNRDYVLNIGRVELNVPRTRSGNFSTEVFEKYKRCDQAFLLSMTEMFVNGVSTRKVSNIVKQLCGENVSKSMVSNLTKKLDPIVKEWANRPLSVYNYRYLFVDAMYIKVREYDKVVSKAVYIGLAVREDGKRDIVGLQVAHAESEENWNNFFDHLISRGFRSPKLIISDAHAGLKTAIQQKFIGSTWQRCSVHLRRNIIDKMPKKDSQEARDLLRNIFEAPSLKVSRMLKEEFMNRYEDEKKYQKALETLDEGYEDAIQFFSEPTEAHAHIRTTNVLERLNGEVRKREKTIRIFPNQQSAFRLIGAVLMDCEEAMDPGNKKYIYFKE